MACDQPPTARGSDLVDLESAMNGASAVIFTMWSWHGGATTLTV
jgi:hypothetical protein